MKECWIENVFEDERDYTTHISSNYGSELDDNWKNAIEEYKRDKNSPIIHIEQYGIDQGLSFNDDMGISIEEAKIIGEYLLKLVNYIESK